MPKQRHITYEPNGGSNQSWTLSPVPNGNGSYFLVNSSSNLCAEDNGGSYAAGAVVDQWTCVDNSTNEQWNITPLPSGGSVITNVRSGLLLTTASKNNLSPLTQQPNINSELQHWTVEG
ncbi:RICIN domain-containing protein [Streptacidiphilus anmyonensis]|uniref:RICIN domain-containing protein n=1 Tax=Streptacidiphilus anmyonensis TaxID=405782 RepID=UPI0005A7D119|nr:RICIN domain-containing protein [Streptacidiphilus anmyonensis]